MIVDKCCCKCKKLVVDCKLNCSLISMKINDELRTVLYPKKPEKHTEPGSVNCDTPACTHTHILFLLQFIPWLPMLCCANHR